jgi:hypothetical protein
MPATRSEKRMKPGPFQLLLDRARSVGIDTTGYDSRTSSAERLRQRIIEKEQKRSEGKATTVTTRRVDYAGIPTMGQTSTNRVRVSRSWMNYMLRYLNHLSGGEKPDAPRDTLTEEQIFRAEEEACKLFKEVR